MLTYKVEKDTDLGLYVGTLTVQLPEIKVERLKKDRSDFKYEMRRAVSEIVEEYIEETLDNILEWAIEKEEYEICIDVENLRKLNEKNNKF